MNEKDFAELAAGAALGALSSEEEQMFRSALDAHPEWRSIAEKDAETAALLADSVAPTAPPPHIRSALLDQISATPQGGEPPRATPSSAVTPGASPAQSEPGAESARRAAPRRWSRMVFALAACLAVLVGVGVAAATLNGQLNRPASVVALEEIQAADDAAQASVELDDGSTATAHWSASLGTAVLVADDIPALAEDQDYELWFVRDSGPVAAGVFDASDGDATAVLDGDMHEGDVIAVTVEQAGGSPSGMPTTEPVIVIPTA